MRPIGGIADERLVALPQLGVERGDDRFTVLAVVLGFRFVAADDIANAFPPSQWKSIRTSNAIERLHEEFKRRIKTQTVLPCAETAALLFWALLASGQITMRKVDGWQTLAEKPDDQIIDLAHDRIALCHPKTRHPIPTQVATGPL